MYMSYSNGLLESTSTKIIEGIPGVGFKLTTDGNYNMNNKRLTNLKPGSTNNDCLTKKQVYDHVKANGGDPCSTPVDLTDYIKRDGSSTMQGHHLMDFNHVQDRENPCQGIKGYLVFFLH